MKFFRKKQGQTGNPSPEIADPFHPYRPSKKAEKAGRPPVPWAKLRSAGGGTRVLSWGMGDGRGGEIRIDGPPVGFSLSPERTDVVVASGEKKTLLSAGSEESATLLIRKIEREFRASRISLPFRWALFLVGAFILVSLLTPTRSVGSVAAGRGMSTLESAGETPVGSVGKKLWTVPSALLGSSDLRRAYGNIGLSCSAGH